MLKLAFCLFNYFPYGGLQRDFARIAQECVRRGYQVDVYTMDWQGDLLRGVNVNKIEVSALSNHKRCLRFSERVQALLKNQAYDLIVGFNKIGGLDVYYAADSCYAAKIYAQKSYLYRSLPRYHTYKKLESEVFAANQSTQILLIAEQEKIKFQRCYGTANDRFHLLPPGIARDRCAPANADEVRQQFRQRLNIKTNQNLVLMIASRFATKGLDRALLAVSALPEPVRKQTWLYVIGDDKIKPWLKLAKRLGVVEQVKFCGAQDNVRDYLLAADLLLHPAYTENTGTVLLEALVAGLPVLTTGNCGYASHVQAAQAGYIIDTPFQQAALDQQLAHMLISEKKSQWHVNALRYAAETDLYNLISRAVDLLEQFAANRKPLQRANLFLSNALRKSWSEQQIFQTVFNLQGRVYREQKNRKTLRFELNDKAYFAKLHQGVGWREIIKNLCYGRLPVLSAEQEWRAIRCLQQLGIPTLTAAGYGKKGINPARLNSFLVTEELTHVISLEELTQTWQTQPPSIKAKRALLKQVAEIACTMHANGINHRDFYLCHFLLDKNSKSIDSLKLYVIDLHRAQIRKRVPRRWLIKDLAGLHFSSMHCGLTERDKLRFIKYYTLASLRAELKQRSAFWRAVEYRALKLWYKTQRQLQENETEKNNAQTAQLHLINEKEPLYIEAKLREIPGKRCVYAATFKGESVIVKCFKNRRQMQRELHGYDDLVKAGVATPTLVTQAMLAENSWPVLLFQRISPAENLQDYWQTANQPQRQEAIYKLAIFIADMHNHGLAQTDLHLKNFLLSTQNLYALDAGSMRKHHHHSGLALRPSLKNIGLLLAQFAPKEDTWLTEVFLRYAQARQWTFNLNLLTKVQAWQTYWRKKRLRAYGCKVLRTSTAFISRKTWCNYWVCDRRYFTEAMRYFLQNPEAALQQSGFPLLKAGNTCTVAQTVIDGKLFVIKRYNIKNFWHGLKRAVTPTRALRSWRNAHYLQLLEIPTAKPVAFLEKRYGCFRRVSYFISEFCPGTKLSDYSATVESKEKFTQLLQQADVVLNQLHNMHLSHGDMKATNILIQNDQLILLDLDAMRLHRCRHRAKQASAKDKQRFDRNWNKQ